MRQCTRCGVEKKLSEFYRASQREGHYRGDCKPCFRGRMKREQPYDREKMQRRRYGVSAPKHGECDLCGQPAELVIDHCHTTNLVRGRLCQLCNRGLGHFRDNVELLQKAVSYLRQHKMEIATAS